MLLFVPYKAEFVHYLAKRIPVEEKWRWLQGDVAVVASGGVAVKTPSE